jgi:transforming growth factor-beta-induced protein
MDQKDIVETAVADGRFKTLVAAVQAAGLVDTLKGEGPFTVFAPTDEAFAALPAGTLDALLAPDAKQQLTDILLYHVVSGKVMAADVAGLTKATTALGKDITIKVEDGKVYLNDSVQVILTDIETSNGVIHVIDAVLLPPQ